MYLAEQLTEKWRTVIRQSDHIWTWTEDHCLAYCAEMASQCTVAVELGTYLGRSAKVMLDANPALHLWCVDTFDVPGIEHTARGYLGKEIAQGRCELIKGDSARAADMLQHMRGRIQRVWVDDGHATEDVKRDIRCFLPLLCSGGVIFGHDFDVPHNDVALGVIASLPRFDIPVPRLWSYVKP
jgi:predicted O-methyltransferase YrrM